MCGHPWTIPGWLKLLGNPGILGQGGVVCVRPSLDNPGMAKLLGNPGILGQGGGGMCVAIPGQSRDGLSYLGIPGYLDKGGWYVCGHPWTIPGWLSYLGIPGYFDKGGHVCGHPWTIPGWLSYLGTWEIPSHVSASLDMSVYYIYIICFTAHY